ncbi:hypothetical protein [Psychromonas sp. KJ10-2]|uniref:hypothetical protein n=1 Tax=Psychromonas sp. KJ10-2 TaxID=3391822 RepID=UPI0039B3F8E0
MSGEAKQVTLDEFRGIGKNKETFSDEKSVNSVKPNNPTLEKNTSNKIKFSVPLNLHLMETLLEKQQKLCAFG